MFDPPGPKPIEGYHAWKEEYETCKWWGRPARKYHTDIPFYPDVPKVPDQIRVSFKLGFQ